MRQKAPELLDIDVFKFENVLCLKNHGIELIKDRSPIKFGALWTLHGHEHKGGMTNPVNPARGLFLRAKVSCLCGHFHQTSQHSEPTLEDHIVSTWGVGALCDMHPAYMPLNRWNPGFAFVEVGKDDSFQVDNLRVVNGKAWH